MGLLLRWVVGVCGVLAVVLPALGDRPWLEAESTYLGDGWFRYRVGTRPCPFISSITLCGVYTDSTNHSTLAWQEEKALPAGWFDSTNNPLGNWETVQGTNFLPQAVPYDAVFDVHSSLTNYQQGQVIITMSLTIYETLSLSGVCTLNIVGYCIFPALVPCTPDQQDLSPTTLYGSQNYHEFVINDLLRDSNGIYGVSFKTPSMGAPYGEATYLLEASPDLNEWRKVAYMYSAGSVTTWTTNVDLGLWGNFFRAEYVAGEAVPASLLPPLDPPTLSTAKSLVQPVTTSDVPRAMFSEKGRLKVSLQTTPGRNYRVRVYDAGKVVWSGQCAASGSQALLELPTDNLPRMGLIRADELP